MLHECLSINQYDENGTDLNITLDFKNQAKYSYNYSSINLAITKKQQEMPNNVPENLI